MFIEYLGKYPALISTKYEFVKYVKSENRDKEPTGEKCDVG